MNALTQRETALPSLQVDDQEMIDVLRNSLYPGAKDASIKLVLSYCKAAGLDPMQKPVHIVPMSVSTGEKTSSGYDKKEMRDVIMPGVGLYRTQAARSGQYAGVSEPDFGPTKTLKFIETLWEDGPNDTRKKRQQDVVLEYPEWCRVTVERVVGGVDRKFTAREYWLENYATKGKDAEPNSMWRRRPFAQLAKCAEAQALRKAFPDSVGSQPTAEEMEGRNSLDDDRTIDMPATTTPVTVDQPKSKSEKKAAAAAPVTDVDPIDKAAPQPATAKPEAPAAEAKPISESMMRVLKTKMENAAVSDADMVKKFGFDLAGVTNLSYNTVIEWFKDPTQ